MIQYVCDNCSAVKLPEEAWIVGLAAESVGAVSARREITIQSAWNRAAAVHPLAVHFCSVQCKDEYTARLFAPEGDVKEVVVERAVPERKRVVTKTRTTTRRKRVA